MFTTLYSKLAAVLFGLVCLIGLLFFILVHYSTQMYQQEVSQKLNATLAKNIVDEEPLLNNGRINRTAVKGVFQMLMAINPRIEVYLLDRHGKILDYSAPAEKIKRTVIDLASLQAFISGDAPFPVLGDDPRDLSKQKIFSTAPVMHNGNIEGYLYIILEGEKFDNITNMLEASYFVHFTIWGVFASLIIALCAGLILFFLLTRRLKGLSKAIACYAEAENNYEQDSRYHSKARPGDEIDKLGLNFNIMADRIDAQMLALKRNDAQRRELIANVSHDLRTPLATLHGYLETLLLKNGNLSDDERKRYLEIAASHSNRLSQLVSELFELSTLDSCESLLNIEPFSLGELVQDITQKFQLAANEKQITLKTQLGRNIPFAYGDIGLMQRVLENLIENALRYTNKGGCIEISLSNDNDKILVKVADTGVGIPADEMPHIFERFYRLDKSRYAGANHAGLGLAIVKRIIDLHGSDIKAESEPEQGTTFTFFINAYSH